MNKRCTVSHHDGVCEMLLAYGGFSSGTSYSSTWVICAYDSERYFNEGVEDKKGESIVPGRYKAIIDFGNNLDITIVHKK